MSAASKSVSDSCLAVVGELASYACIPFANSSGSCLEDLRFCISKKVLTKFLNTRDIPFCPCAVAEIPFIISRARVDGAL